MAQEDGSAAGFSIVLVGSMNPPLHHPTWYRVVGAITPEDEKAALDRDYLFVPQLAQFGPSDDLQITCDTQRWQVMGAHKSHVGRALDLVRLVFDERLNETPIAGYGLNFYHHVMLPGLGVNVGERLATLVSTLPLGLPGGTDHTASLSHSSPIPGGKLNLSVQASVRVKGGLFLGFNADYPLESSVPGHVALRPLFDQRLKDLEPLLDKYLMSVTRCLKGIDGGAR